MNADGSGLGWPTGAGQRLSRPTGAGQRLGRTTTRAGGIGWAADGLLDRAVDAGGVVTRDSRAMELKPVAVESANRAATVVDEITVAGVASGVVRDPGGVEPLPAGDGRKGRGRPLGPFPYEVLEASHAWPGAVAEGGHAVSRETGAPAQPVPRLEIENPSTAVRAGAENPGRPHGTRPDGQTWAGSRERLVRSRIRPRRENLASEWSRPPVARHRAPDRGEPEVPRGSMIADTNSGAPHARAGESEVNVAVPVARDASADTPIARAAQAAMNARARNQSWPQPQSCRVLTIANQKGGVGKTTTAVNVAASLAMHGSRVLVIDLDPQGNASTALDVEHRSGGASIYDVLVDGQRLAGVVKQVQGFAELSCAPATIDLAGAEIELVSVVARESRLSRALAEFDASQLDYIFIDCPPSLGLLTVNALVAAPEVLIPIQCEYYALEGLEQLLRTIELVKSHLNPGLAVSTILLTMFDSRTRLASQVAEEVRSHFGDLVLKSVIPRSVRVSEAPSYGQSVMTYDPGSSGALAYLEAARELAFRNTEAAPA
jgi:chromosome partitioning protein